MDLHKYLKSCDTPAFEKVLKGLRTSTDKISVSGLQDSSRAFFLSYLFTNNPDLYFIICPSQKQARELHMDMEGILGEKHALRMPEMDVSPYEWRTTHHLIQEQRFQVIDCLLQNSPAVITTSFKAICQLMVSPSRLKENIIEFNSGDSHDPEELIKKLFILGFEQVDMVENTGQFSRRGGILDVFPRTELESLFLKDNNKDCRQTLKT